MPPLDAPHTDTSKIPELVRHVRERFRSGRTRGLAWRRAQLLALRRMMVEREAELHEALRRDLGRPAHEAFIAETGFLIAELDHAQKHLAQWMKPEKVKTPLINQPGSSRVVREPLGVALIIGAWNYPVQLLLSPLVGALAAGNCAVLKPSELSPHTSAVLAELVPRYVDPECIRVVEGGVAETTALLAERFDHVFYTGGGTVGRIVMEAAAKHLTPVTLELGGKSPCIVDEDVDLDVAARRIVWGKFFNAGQTCVAPDYVLVHERLERAFLDALSTTARTFYGADPAASPDYSRIVNDRHFARLSALLSDGERVFGGQTDAATRYIAPTVLRNVSPTSKIMADEIFGPILPVLTVRDTAEAIAFVNERPKPLALYVFTRRAETASVVVEQTSSGGVCVNDTMAHLGVPELPFGGVGPSGMGAYHGRHSFECFSHRKAVLEKSTRVDPWLRYPPYDADKIKWVRRMM